MLKCLLAQDHWPGDAAEWILLIKRILLTAGKAWRTIGYYVNKLALKKTRVEKTKNGKFVRIPESEG